MAEDQLGIPFEALDFYEGLEADNSKAYWQAHRTDYERFVRDPMQRLVAALAPEFGPGKLFRPYRDVRFSHDKSPYKTTQGAICGRGDGGAGGMARYVAVSASGLFVGAGSYEMAPDQVERYRAAVADDATGEDLVAIVAQLRADGDVIGGTLLRTRPRGVAADHPRLPLLRHRSITASRDFGAPPWLETPTVVDEVAAAWRRWEPLLAWLADRVGPSDLPRR